MDWILAAIVVLGSVTAAWFWHLKLRNAGVIDVVWGLNQALAAAVLAALGHGWGPRRALIAGLVGLTGLRLSWHLYRRVLGHPEEGRYVALRQAWGAKGDIARVFLLFFLAQGVLVLLLAVPFWFVAKNPAPAFSALELGATALFLLACVGEGLADAQLKAYKADPTRGPVCRRGLWAYSRHPNYFFEWLMWVAYALLAAAAPGGWVAAYAPLLMLHFLLNVTGVKYTEAQCLRSKGAAYAAYQREVSMFVPLPPSKD